MHATTGMPLWALANAPATGKNTRSFIVLDQIKIRFFTYMLRGAEGEAATVTTSDLLGYLHRDRVLLLLQLIRLESLGNEHKTANNLLPVSQKSIMCYCRKRSSSGYWGEYCSEFYADRKRGNQPCQHKAFSFDDPACFFLYSIVSNDPACFI